MAIAKLFVLHANTKPSYYINSTLKYWSACFLIANQKYSNSILNLDEPEKKYTMKGIRFC